MLGLEYSPYIESDGLTKVEREIWLQSEGDQDFESRDAKTAWAKHEPESGPFPPNIFHQIILSTVNVSTWPIIGKIHCGIAYKF